MDYTVLHIAVSDDEQAEILTAELADFPFESFETEGGLLKAYIPAVRLSGCKTDVDALLARRGVEGRYAVIPTQNWNASWESDFPPVDVEGRLRIRAPFHDPAPAGEMEAVVLPRMSFGTGHHATTWLMSRAVLGLGVAGRTGLDMGSGTGVLVEPMLGDVGRIAGRRYDFILANINRNVLVADMPAYAAALVPGGDLVMSGFLEADTAAVTQAAAEQGMETVAAETREGWMMIRVKKKK